MLVFLRAMYQFRDRYPGIALPLSYVQMLVFLRAMYQFRDRYPGIALPL